MAARIQVQREARRGEIIECGPHPAPDGDRFRLRRVRRQTPRNVIYSFECRYGGVEVFRAAMGAGMREPH